MQEKNLSRCMTSRTIATTLGSRQVSDVMVASSLIAYGLLQPLLQYVSQVMANAKTYTPTHAHKLKDVHSHLPSSSSSYLYLSSLTVENQKPLRKKNRLYNMVV